MDISAGSLNPALSDSSPDVTHCLKHGNMNINAAEATMLWAQRARRGSGSYSATPNRFSFTCAKVMKKNKNNTQC